MTIAELRASSGPGDAGEPTMDATAGASALRALLARSDRKGLERLAIHLGLIALSSVGIFLAQGSPLILPAMVVQGILIAYLFAPLHEGSHYTPFKTRWLTDLVAWLSGAAIIWNSSFLRYSHLWHHRYIQDPTRDPELESPKPTNLREYLRRLSGFDYLRGNIRAQLRILGGRFEGMPYIPAAARPAVRRSVAWQFAVYAALAAVAIRYPGAVLLYWLVPLLLGYPFLLTVLIPEHAGCAENGDNYANTRTTYTWWPLRLIYWNMSYHAEHHANPAIPFHALPAAHQLMKHRVTHIETGGYIAWTREYIRKLRAS
jgi:fatty acid desaturase